MGFLLLYHTLAFITLFSYGLYHLTLSSISFLKPSPTPYSARPYHPLPLRRPHPLLRHLPLLLISISLLLSLIHHLLPPLSLPSLHTSLSLSLFLLLSLSLLLPLPLPSDLSFLLLSLSFLLLSLSPSPPSDLQSKTSSLSSAISLSSSLFSLALAVSPSLFIFDLALACSISLQGLWSLQTGLALYVESFIPYGCHQLLDVGVETTRCDVDESRVRAGQILDLVFAVNVVVVAVLGVVVFVVVGKVCGGGGVAGLGRRGNGGSYEALPTVASAGDLDHAAAVQMKAIGKSSAQA